MFDRDQLVTYGEMDQVDDTVNIQLGHQVGAMSLDRAHADLQFIRDVGIAHPNGNSLQYLSLTGGKSIQR